MKFTKDQFVKYMKEFHAMDMEENNIANDLNICEWWGLNVLSTMFDLIDTMCDLRKDDLIGDYLSYWYYELELNKNENIEDPKSFEELYDYLVTYEQA